MRVTKAVLIVLALLGAIAFVLVAVAGVPILVVFLSLTVSAWYWFGLVGAIILFAVSLDVFDRVARWAQNSLTEVKNGE